MIYQTDYEALAAKINPIAFSKYLLDTGWSQFLSKRKDIRIFQKNVGTFYQVIIPMDIVLSDYNNALFEACKKVAESESKTVEQLLLYLLNPNADILKIRIENKNVEAGNILIDDAIEVYENAKKLLGTAAQDVIKPTEIHRGRIDSVVSNFLANCRFGQTEVGSYIVSVICPMVENDNGQVRQLEMFESAEDEETNFTRKVTSKVVKNLYHLKTRIDDGEYNLAKTSKDDEISVNFYEALLGIKLADEHTTVEFIPEWAPSVPLMEDLPKSIALSHNYYQPIQSTVSTIRGIVKRKERIVGRIKRLESTPDLENRQVGKVTVVYVDDNNKARTIISKLARDDYNKAIEAHANGAYVEIIGEMQDTHIKEIECESFNVI